MKNKRFLIISISLFLVTSSAYANKMMNVDEKVEKMKMDLNLTQEQVDKIRPIIQDYKDAMEKAHQDKESKLNRILSSDQMRQLKAMKKDKHSEG